jgi:hypothetical protein
MKTNEILCGCNHTTYASCNWQQSMFATWSTGHFFPKKKQKRFSSKKCTCYNHERLAAAHEAYEWLEEPLESVSCLILKKCLPKWHIFRLLLHPPNIASGIFLLLVLWVVLKVMTSPKSTYTTRWLAWLQNMLRSTFVFGSKSTS